MHLIIAKVNEVLYDGEAESLTVPAVAGEMTVLARHMPLITTLKQGIVTVRPKDNGDLTFQIVSGILEVRPDGATVIL
ncbi:hypothetical protein A2852_02570 [Candidatus Adlerbacteria bacterium RIFCSPHIGHO2_01_FULL_54_23]|uniref:ATP synthase F1 complex delta/epsilon subunit N-terminal domain-containing protein n=3 Tax=Candidatus Adleribacteriota TaxID=1752736 RepID=A0A1F4Y1E3_9BACT|nr:MAG: ATP synthase epsilon chain [Candidatus Adlerbacteria bacterium GW2011_GWA1_54_10]KKW38002.1 MAG: ATP synthase epsilon chain [Candidatus Adlerbacteria bacterium GW2011_GWB1_54_7]OGC78609.1 MAG: hypothetical protein A2852_02570 [Candidatus Adlerbacteria bacterium RIFCSPHIGHO2_01_FULL_54_23]OGC87616.1 MAG: hypothetical protein A3B33_01765 [Candidatus Adlerbacteria bacterium RIFCSPLOWO2_01_FULL_54_16]